MIDAHSSYDIWKLNQAFRAAVEAVMLERQELWEMSAMLEQRSYILHSAIYGRWYDTIYELERMSINTDALLAVAILLYGPIRLPRRLYPPLPEEVNHHAAVRD